MNLAEVSANGQITVPIAIREMLHLKEGDKILFSEKGDGEIVVNNAQKYFEKAIQNFGVGFGEGDRWLVDERR